MADKKVTVEIETTGTGKLTTDLKDGTDQASGFVDQLGLGDTAVGKLFGGISKGAKIAVTAFRSLKGAIAATGIGILLIAIGSLVNYLKNTEEGSNKLGLATAKLKGFWMGFTGEIGNQTKELFKWKNIIESLKNPHLYLSKAIDDALKVGDKISNQAEIIARNQQNFNVWIRKNNLAQEENNGLIFKQQQISQDQTKTLEERVAALDEVGNLQKKNNDAAVLQAKEELLLTRQTNQNKLNAGKKLSTEEIDLENQKAVKVIQVTNQLYQQQIQIAAQRSALIKQTTTEELTKLKELQDKRNEIALIGLKGKEAELLTLKNAYQSDLTNYADNEAMKVLVTQKYLKEKAFIEKTYAEESEKLIKSEADKLLLDQLYGKAKELEVLRQAYVKEIETAKGNTKALELIDQNYLLNKQKIEDNYTQKDIERFDGYVQKIKDLKKEQTDKEKEADLEYQNYKLSIDGENAVTADEKLQVELKKLDIWYKEQKNKYKDSKEALNTLDLEYADKKKEVTGKSNLEEINANKEKYNDLKKSALDNIGVIAGAVFEGKKSELDNEMNAELSNKNLTEEQKTEIQKKYAKERQKDDIKAAIIAGALAILNGLNTKPFFPAGVIAAGTALVATGIQIATIKRQKFKDGGDILGPSHSGGGVNINAEGGEFVSSVKTMQSPWGNTIRDINKSVTTGQPVSAPISEERIAEIATAAAINVVKKVQISASAYDIKDGTKKVEVKTYNYAK